MANLIIETAKYLMLFLFAYYTCGSFAVYKKNISPKKREQILNRQCAAIYLIHLLAYSVIYLVTDDIGMVLFYFVQVMLFTVIQTCYVFLYGNSSRLLTNHLCMLLAVGFIILTRLNLQQAIKQVVIAAVSVLFSLLVPVLIKRVGFIRRLYWLFAALGIIGLLVVAVLGSATYGAKISLSIAGISVQPSEFIKIAFVFFVAGILHTDTSFPRVCAATAVAAAHILLLVLSKDLGAALIFFITYLVMLYVATGKLFYFIGGFLAGAAASVAAYRLFAHVRVRVLAWSAPLTVIDNEGYQICQSLFAIGTGGWFGMGLYQGSPNKIPVVTQDFIFSAISEELGGGFALCLIMVCISCFLMFLNIAMQMKDRFYKLTALGLGTVYGFQVILTIGGVIKLIPSTGVTLPLISYGGSSCFSSMILFAIIQGLYILRQEGEANDKKRIRTKTKKRKQENGRRTSPQ